MFVVDAVDRSHLEHALRLAEQAIGLSDPNPRVGCVLANAGGEVVAHGFTQQVGGPHAEAMALHAAERDGHALTGGTAWVTLEPCAHHGRTPPCADALVRAGLRRVVIAIGDPFPSVAGAGMQRLRDAGVQVDLLDPADPLAEAAHRMNVGFFHRIRTGRPWVRMKVAASMDGRTALPNGASKWITGPAARTDTHSWRKRASAIVTGIGTALADQPRLDVRLVETAVQPLRVVVDSRLQLPPDAPMLKPPGRCLVATVSDDRARRAALEAAGAEVVVMRRSDDGRVDLNDLLLLLAQRQVNEIHLEAGATLNGAFLSHDLVDEVVAYVAPKILGAGPGTAHFGPIEALDDAVAFRLLQCHPVGDDVRMQWQRVRAS